MAERNLREEGMAQWQRKIHRAVKRRRVVTPNSGELRTKEAQGDPTDVQSIMRKYLIDRSIPAFNPGIYGDFTSGSDYSDALCAVRDAEARFLELPAHVRQAVGNDPAELLDLVHDPERIEEARALGLIEGATPGAPQMPPIDRPGGAVTPDAPSPAVGDSPASEASPTETSDT